MGTLGTVYLTPPGPPAWCRVFRGGFILLFDYLTSVNGMLEMENWVRERPGEDFGVSRRTGTKRLWKYGSGLWRLWGSQIAGIGALHISHSIWGPTQPQRIIRILSQCTAGFFHGHQLRNRIVQPTPKTHLQHTIIQGHVMAELQKLFHKILQGADILIEGEQLVHRVNSCWRKHEEAKQREQTPWSNNGVDKRWRTDNGAWRGEQPGKVIPQQIKWQDQTTRVWVCVLCISAVLDECGVQVSVIKLRAKWKGLWIETVQKVRESLV